MRSAQGNTSLRRVTSTTHQQMQLLNMVSDLFTSTHTHLTFTHQNNNLFSESEALMVKFYPQHLPLACHITSQSTTTLEKVFSITPSPSPSPSTPSSYNGRKPCQPAGRHQNIQEEPHPLLRDHHNSPRSLHHPLQLVPDPCREA